MADMILLGTIAWELGAKLLCFFSLNVKPINLELFNKTIKTFSYWSQFKFEAISAIAFALIANGSRAKDMTQISSQTGP